MASFFAYGYSVYTLSSGTWTLFANNQYGSGYPLLTATFRDDFAPGDAVSAAVLGNVVGTFYGYVVDDGVTFLGVMDNQGRLQMWPDTEGYSYGASFSDSSVTKSSYLACFLEGTAILTGSMEEIRVEQLRSGDVVATADGRVAIVRWVWRQTVATVFLPSERAPVEIAAGALGEDLPKRALRVTPDHALLIDGLLVQAGALVNGTTIRRLTEEDLGERFTVYHVETEAHELILAEGVASETFLDEAARHRFDNHGDYRKAFGGDGPSIAELPLPRVKSHRQLSVAARERLAARAPEPEAVGGYAA